MVAFPAAAGAAPSTSVYADFAAHGKLTRHYSRAQLEAALKNALDEGYGSTAGAGLKPVIRHQLRQGQGQVLGAGYVAPQQAAGVLPFTGVDLGLIAVGGAGLLLIGGGLRRFARAD